jgi:NADPH2:quinone reductase
MPAHRGLQLQSLATADGILRLTLPEVETPAPGPDDVIVRVEAAPINPSDLGLLLAGAEITTARRSGDVMEADIPPAFRAMAAARGGQAMPVGNEGAGVVVDAGTSPAARALIGKTVAILGGATYAQYRSIRADQCLVLPPGVTPAQGASCFVNPLTVLGMIGTMRMEGHTALVHTAAASNLGQMLVKACKAEGIPLVNIVRRDEHVALLKGIGAVHVLNSTSPTFRDDLAEALHATGATLAFDAIGGGRLGGQILAAMEVAAMRSAGGFNRYGSTVHKQLYIYGGLDRGPTEFNRAFGMAWGMGGWLLTPFLQKIGPAGTEELRQRVAREITTTFASSYTKTVSLRGVLDPAEVAVYGLQATGEKYLINPNKDI